IDEAAKRCARQRWPGALELGGVAMLRPGALGRAARTVAEGATLAEIGGGLPCVEAIKKAFSEHRCKSFVENVVGRPQGDVALVSEELRINPYRIEAIDMRLAGRPRLRWLSWKLVARERVAAVGGDGHCCRIKPHADPNLSLIWAEDGRGLLGLRRAPPTSAKACKGIGAAGGPAV
ncbi:unnamed protein product, partial [Prorocentrum cordatum]